MKRNQIALGCVASIIVPIMLLVGCGGGDDSSATPTAEAVTTQTPSATMGVPTAPASPAAPADTPTTVVAPATVDSPVTLPTQAPEIQPTVALQATATPVPVASGAASLTITAIDTKFSPSSATLPAGAVVTLTFDNQDIGVTHDIVIFDPAGSTLAATDLAEGAIVQTALFTLGGPGAYSFKCSVHPREMKGYLQVQ